MIVAVLFSLAYVFYLLFIKQSFKDIPAQVRKKLEQAAKLSHNEMLGDLYLSGDDKHNRIKYGKYVYLRFRMPKITKEAVMEKGKPKLDEYGSQVVAEKTEELEIDAFIINRKGFFNRMFNDPIFILCYPQDHDYSSIFNDVVIHGFNIVPLDNYFYTIDRRNLDMDLTKALAGSYLKEVTFEVLRDLDKLVKATINLDNRFQKEKEKSTEFELPQPLNQNQR